MTTEQNGYRVAIFIPKTNQYLYMEDKLTDGNPYFSVNKMLSRRIDSMHEAHDMGASLADAYETTYIIEPWYETGRDSA